MTLAHKWMGWMGWMGRRLSPAASLLRAPYGANNKNANRQLLVEEEYRREHS